MRKLNSFCRRGFGRLSALFVLAAVVLSPLAAVVAFHLGRVRPVFFRQVRAWWNGAEYLGDEGVIPQSSVNDCGVACLRMVLKAKGVTVGAASLRQQAGISRAGTSLFGLKRAAEANGLTCSVWFLGNRDLTTIPLPAVAHFDGNHFVVIEGAVSHKNVTVLDPARGRLKYSEEAFQHHWKGPTLVCGGRWEVEKRLSGR